jgi:M6 family metalloprotease-like protein
MKIITSLTKVLILATGLYFSAGKATAQVHPVSSPTSCVASTEQLTLLQPNGTSITIVGKGNLHNHWTETVDGYSVVRNTTGNYEYATKINGNLSPSGILVTNPANRSFVEATYASSLTKSAKPDSSPLKGSILSQVARQIQNKTFPTTGNIKVLALLIDYPDLINVIPASDFDSLLYGANYLSGNGSFKTFYETSSGGQLTIDVDVRGWYRASNNFQYYAADSGYDRAADLVREAVNAAEIAGTDFSLYDNDSNGSVDGILAVHSGPGAEIGSQSGLYIWSHRWVMRAGNLGSAFYDGVSIDDYMINPETRSATNNGISGIGVFCHEFGHNLGLPDLYDTDNTNGDSEGIGNWCLMAGGAYSGSSNRPSNFSAWCKEELGWDVPQIIPLSQTGTYTLPPASTSRNEIYKVSVPFPITDEYFLIENRQLVGKDSDLPGHGLAIWHINTTKTNSFGNSVNADETLKGVDLEEADGNDDLDNEVNRGDGGDLFPGTSTRTTFDDTTTPSAQDYLLGNTGLQIRNIVETVGGSVSFDFGRVPGPPCAATTSFTTNTGSFDDGSGTGLDYVNNQTCTWLITPATGTVTLSFSAFDIEPTNDTVTVYDGGSATAVSLGTYSGNAIPASLTSTSNAMFIQFKSNATISGPGFDASFITNIPPAACSGLTNLTAATGNFTDGSGTANYTNNQSCSWLIQPAGAASITFGLNSLATEIGNDIITVYDGTSAASPILGSFSGTNNLNTFTSSTGSIFVTFITNATITDQGFDAFYTSTTSTAGCSGSTTLTATSGSFSDGSMTNNYNNNQFCSWLIQPPSGTVTLSFSAFATEVNFDRVLVFDGLDNTATQIGSFDGSAIPASLTSTTNSLYIEFRTNGTITDAGWDASYINNIPTTPCTGLTTITTNTGTFDDGSIATANYTDNSNCSWLIQPSAAGVLINLNFARFNTEAGNDMVTVYDGTTTADPVLATLSGTNPPLPNILSTGGDLLITFVTNSSITNLGWEANFTTQSVPPCSATPTVFNAASGTFNDGSSATANYQNNQNCEWLIQPTGASIIRLDFSRFNTEFCCDDVTVHDGTNASATVLGTFRGTSLPPFVTSSGGALFIVFNTDGSVTETGWEASYVSSTNQCFSNLSLTGQTGNLSDGSGTSNYQDNLSCSWVIEPPRATSVTATFINFNVDNGADTLYLYDGTNNSAPLLGKFTGSTNPTAQIATTGTMFVEFVTDGSTNNTGWDLNYTSVIPLSCSGLTTLVVPSGTVEDGSLLGNYSTNLNCTWLIQPSGSPAVINFTMTSLDLSTTGGFANRDNVRIYDGVDNTGTLLRQFTGTFLFNPTASAFSGSMFIEFTTNGNSTAQGWEGTYNSSSTYCVPQTTFTANFGNFSDGSPSGQNYLDNSDCSWLIQPTTPNVAINLQFSQFDTETANDTVTVYDGASTNDPILATIYGNNPTIPALLSSGGDMLVTFKTNGNTVANGWQANYGTQVIPACNGTTTLTNPTGTFDDGTTATARYAPNLNCSWLIQPTGASLVSLTFNRFDTQQNADVVSIYDGSNNSATLIGAFDGNTVPSTIFSSGSSLFVEFTSNGFFELTGWEASYSSTTSQCFTNLSVLTYSGNIEDGSGANNYQDNLGCSWLIEPPLATTVTATFNSFDLSTAGDTLFIYDGNSSSAPRLAAYTGTILPAAVTSTSNEMFVEFITNGNTNTTGWDFDYTTTLNVSCAGTTNFTAASTTFDDGSAVTANYDNNLSCNWLIQPTGNPATITLTMNRFNLSGGFGDRVEVYDNALGSGFPIGQFFGTTLGNPVVSFTGVMFVQFITNASGTSTGWDATYNTSATYCQPNTLLTGNSGNFTDGSPFGQNYLDNTSCEWLIQPAAINVAVTINFFGFDTELTNDTVTVYDGATTASQILGTFSGNTNPPILTSSGGDMLVSFKSNGSTTATGWSAFYNTQPIPACAGTTTLNQATATFDDGSATFANYVDNSNCSWLIAPLGALNIDLTFNRFNTQTTNDVVNVYDGNNNSALLIGSYSGATIPAVINSTGGSLFLEFITDGFGTSSGWEASYTSFNTVTLNIQQDTAYLNAGAGSTNSLTLTSNVAWTNADNATWLIASPVNGSGNSTINLLAVQPNIGPERSAQLITTATLTNDADTVVVIQRSSGRYIDVTPDTLYFIGTSASNQSANINSNVSWTLTPDQPWIMATPSTGIGSGISSVMVQNNTLGSIRTSFVLVTGTLNAANDTIWIIQDTAVTSSNPTLSLDKMNITLAQTVASSDVFTVNSNTTWQTTSGATWLTVTNPAILSDTQTVIVAANSMNIAPLPRASFVAVQDAAGTIFDTLFVFQAGTTPILIGAPDTVLLGAISGSSGVLNIGSTGIWTGIEGNPWFSMSQNSGSGITTINLTTNSANTSTTRLLSYVALADVANNLTDSIIVIQDTLTVGLAASPDTVRVGAAVGSSSTFTISASQSWIATAPATWITVTPAAGNGSGSVSVSADANPGITERLSFIEVSTTGGAINTDTVWVIQEGFVASLVVNPSTINLGFLANSTETASIVSNTSWVITNPASWLSVSSTSGINDQVLTISTTSDNLTGTTRTAILLVDGIGAITQTITVNQVDGSSPIFISSTDTVFVDNLQGSTGSFSVLSNANSWTVTENTSWMLINPTSGSQTQTVTALAATRNIYGSTRYANITANSSGFSNFTVVVAQKESNPIFQVAPDSILIGADSSDFKEFNISSNMPVWNISESATWLRISPENGAFTQRVRATASSQNNTGVQRSTIATVTAPPLVPKTIRIVQDTIRTIGIENNSLEIGLNVYPNPTAGVVTIEFGVQANVELAAVKLFNLLGEQVPISITFSAKNKLYLNLADLNSGIYFFSVQLNGETINKKLILTE